ncbi:hypothetical protein BHM03_00013409 [Ensete ventricosum]|uniref:Uncharacterized protein n=1 Tax=Ensete ventricosum TaxID=4639 RepID=A0A445MDW1_ENSVE|nr:hypothetical protein BHM03_00013409 [Ensete ventricosum]
MGGEKDGCGCWNLARLQQQDEGGTVDAVVAEGRRRGGRGWRRLRQQGRMATAFGRKTGRMGDGDTVEGWKAIATKEEAVIVVDDGLGCDRRSWMESRKRKQRQQVRQQQWRRRFTWVTGEDGMGSREKVVEKHGWSATVAGRRGTEVAEGRKGIGGLGCSEEGLGYDRSGWEGSGEGCGSGRAARSGEEAKEEAEEGAAGAATKEGYGRLEAAAAAGEQWGPAGGNSGREAREEGSARGEREMVADGRSRGGRRGKVYDNASDDDDVDDDNKRSNYGITAETLFSIHTGLLVDRYTYCSLPGDIADWGYFRSVTTLGGRYRAVSTEGGRKKKREKKKRVKKRKKENLKPNAALHPRAISLPAGDLYSPHWRRNVSKRREKEQGDVVGTRTARYRAVSPKIDRRRLIEGDIDRRWSIEGEIDRQRPIEGEKGKKKRKRRKKEKRSTYFPMPSSPACRPSLPAGRQRPRCHGLS